MQSITVALLNHCIILHIAIVFENGQRGAACDKEAGNQRPFGGEITFSYSFQWLRMKDGSISRISLLTRFWQSVPVVAGCDPLNGHATGSK
jgi:hypothetical protein